MTAFLTLLAGKASTYLIGAGAILIAFVATYAKGRLSGAKREREKQAAKERDSYEQELDDLASANIARNRVDGRLPDHDPYRRD